MKKTKNQKQGKLFLHINGVGYPLDVKLTKIFFHLAKNNVLRGSTISPNKNNNQNIIIDKSDMINVINYLICNILGHSVGASEIVLTFWRIKSIWNIAKKNQNKFSDPENHFLSVLLHSLTGTKNAVVIDEIVESYIPLIEALHISAGINIIVDNIDEVLSIEKASGADIVIMNLLAS